MTTINRAIRLTRIPEGWPVASDFALVPAPVPTLGPGEVLIKVRYLSLDPWTRFQLEEPGQVVVSESVGEVVASQDPAFAPGDAVWGMTGWQEYAVMSGARLRKVETYGQPLSAALGVLGFTGLTAYCSLLDKAPPQPGETAVITGAAGAVGSVAAQIARIRGCKVIGIAGSDAKVDYLTGTLGLDHALNYHKVADWNATLKVIAPEGVAFLLDGVGGAIQDGVVQALRPGARVVLIGAISQYNVVPTARQPRLLDRFAGQVTRFSAGDYASRLPEAQRALAAWMSEGRLTYRETITDGIENAPAAFLGMMRGENIGKALVRLHQALVRPRQHLIC